MKNNGKIKWVKYVSFMAIKWFNDNNHDVMIIFSKNSNIILFFWFSLIKLISSINDVGHGMSMNRYMKQKIYLKFKTRNQ